MNGEDRDVPIIGDARAALESLRKAHPAAEFVFVRKNGQRVRDFGRAWNNATGRAGLAGRNFHGLRRGWQRGSWRLALIRKRRG